MAKKINIVSQIKNVLSVEAASILATRKMIGSSFSQVVKLIFRCRGKIVVTGIGKSGLVAQKIASTLVSTGTPAIYLHPVEAVHGNLGVVSKIDIVLAIGKSGESEEILNILPSIKKIGAKIIGMTSNRKSTLAKNSAHVLYLPVNREVCPLNLAPTTSSTLFLVVGDAIAVALMKLRGFNSERFALYHPGGILGKRLLLKVADIMRKGNRNPIVKDNASLKKLLIEITTKWTGAASVVNSQNKLVGLVTDFDIRRAFAKGEKISELTLKNIMNPSPVYMFDDENISKALDLMENREKPITVLPVVNRNRNCIGMLHLHDLIMKGLLPEP
ncbi:hypothetical protein BVX98_04145 [bacterium F11]|nr:hypothetical protein BVX98_04145 [bacterium F11]